jgi:hypothetical protein
MGDLAGRLEPQMRCEVVAQTQQWLLGQLRNFERAALAEAMIGGQHGQHIHGIEQPVMEFALPRRHDRQVDIAALQAARQPRAALFDQANLDPGVPPAIEHQKIGKQRLDHLRRGADAQHA